jgi:hypothetical protein
MVMLYKSCSAFHMESNKIGFAIFWFVYNFLCIWQVSAKLLVLFKIPLCNGVPGSFHSLTDTPLVCSKDPGKNVTAAMWSLGAGCRWARRILAVSPPFLVGDSLGRTMSSLGFDMGADFGVGQHRWGGTAAPWLADRGSSSPAKRGAQPGQGATRVDPGDDGEAPRLVARY